MDGDCFIKEGMNDKSRSSGIGNVVHKGNERQNVDGKEGECRS
jgi:hypothetical protein